MGRKTDSTSTVTLEIIECNEDYFKFYGLQLLKGTFPSDDKSMLINETAALQMNMNDPIGKSFLKKVITGIVKDFYIAPPTIPAKPMIFTQEDGSNISSDIIFICLMPFNRLNCINRQTITNSCNIISSILNWN